MGFQFSETMLGHFQRDGATDERAMRFSLTARARSWLGFLRDHTTDTEGIVHMDGFASDAPLTGTLNIDPIFGHVIGYQFEFTGDDKHRYLFRGQKDVTIEHPVESMTVLRGSILDARENPVASALLKFPLDELPSFILSFRPW
jgi:hypothetical protein